MPDHRLVQLTVLNLAGRTTNETSSLVWNIFTTSLCSRCFTCLPSMLTICEFNVIVLHIITPYGLTQVRWWALSVRLTFAIRITTLHTLVDPYILRFGFLILIVKKLHNSFVVDYLKTCTNNTTLMSHKRCVLYSEPMVESHKTFSEWKQVHVGMEPYKTTTKLDGNDTTTLSHHPYILCHFAAAYTNMLCVFVSCVQGFVEGSVVCCK